MNDIPFKEISSKIGLLTLSKNTLMGLGGLLLISIVIIIFFLMNSSKGSALEVETEPDATDSNSATALSASAASADVQTQEPISIYVHVSGAVRDPGLVELEKGSRVASAIQAAGGFSETANSASINLARVVVDGEQIFVSEIGESAPSTAQSTSNITGTSNVAGAQPAPSASQTTSGKVNINTADASALITLPGIGESTAAKIIADRESKGQFMSTSDITRVSGIGEKKYEAIADLICV